MAPQRTRHGRVQHVTRLRQGATFQRHPLPPPRGTLCEQPLASPGPRGLLPRVQADWVLRPARASRTRTLPSTATRTSATARGRQPRGQQVCTGVNRRLRFEPSGDRLTAQRAAHADCLHEEAATHARVRVVAGIRRHVPSSGPPASAQPTPHRRQRLPTWKPGLR